jgi:hypothetical protein
MEHLTVEANGASFHVARVGRGPALRARLYPNQTRSPYTLIARRYDRCAFARIHDRDLAF